MNRDRNRFNSSVLPGSSTGRLGASRTSSASATTTIATTSTSGTTTTNAGNAEAGRSHNPIIASPTEHPLYPILSNILDVIQKSQQAQKTETSKLKTMLCAVQDELAKLRQFVKEQAEREFSIETSVFKNDIKVEISALFMKTLTRIPAKEDIARVIRSVLKAQCESKTKFDKAVTFCSTLLTNLRAEERRRLLGQGACAPFLTYSTDLFVDKFMHILKVDDSEIKTQYKLHVAIMRSFVRDLDKENEKHMRNIYKAFQSWLLSKFENGTPTSEDLQEIYQDEHILLYEASEGQTHDDEGFNTSPS